VFSLVFVLTLTLVTRVKSFSDLVIVFIKLDMWLLLFQGPLVPRAILNKKYRNLDKMINYIFILFLFYLSWLPPLLLLRLLLPRPKIMFSSELVSSSTSLVGVLRSEVDCVTPFEDFLLCCIDIDCGAVWRSFFVDADVDLM